jgi:hypothetical protein
LLTGTANDGAVAEGNGAELLTAANETGFCGTGATNLVNAGMMVVAAAASALVGAEINEGGAADCVVEKAGEPSCPRQMMGVCERLSATAWERRADEAGVMTAKEPSASNTTADAGEWQGARSSGSDASKKEGVEVVDGCTEGTWAGSREAANKAEAAVLVEAATAGAMGANAAAGVDATDRAARGATCVAGGAVGVAGEKGAAVAAAERSK